jgi:PIN domain nuclease of toxin-antitoxin system
VPGALLDTCVAIWLSQGEKLANEAETYLTDVARRKLPTFVSPITAWEVGLLISRKRLNLGVTPGRWFDSLFEAPHVRLAELSAGVLIGASFLPGKPPRDPADRILAATARELGAILITRDRALLDYGDQGHISTMAC